MAKVGTAQAAVTAPNPAAAYYHFMLGRWYEGRAGLLGDPEDVNSAIEQYREAMHADPGSAYLPAQMAGLLFRAGRTGDAIRLARSVVRAHPENLGARELLGWIYTRLLGNEHDASTHELLGLAIAQYQVIVKLRPADSQNHYRLAQLYIANHQLATAAEELKTVLRLKPGYPAAVTSLIGLDGRQKNLAAAQAVLNTVPAGARTAAMHAAMARAERRNHQPKAAILEWQQALQLAPQNRAFHRSLARLLTHYGSSADAIGQYLWLTQRDPQDARAWLQLTALYEKRGEFPRAEAALGHAAKLLPESPEIGYFSAMLDEAEGKPDRAIAALQHLLKQTAAPNRQYAGEAAYNRSAFLQELGRLERAQGNMEAALADFHRMQSLGPLAERRAWVELAETYRRQHQYTQALNSARQGLRHFPQSQSLRISTALLEAETGQVQDGLTTLAPLAAVDPQSPQLLLISAQVKQAGKRWSDALHDARQAERLAQGRTQRGEAALVLAGIFNQRHRFHRAETYYRRALALNPHSPMVLNDYGYMLADRGVHLHRALAYIQQAVHLSANHGAYWDSLGWVQFKLHLWPQAAANLLRAARLQQQDPTVLGHLGTLYLHTGHLRRAARYLTQAVAAWQVMPPGDFDARQAAQAQRLLRQARRQLARRLKAGARRPARPGV